MLTVAERLGRRMLNLQGMQSRWLSTPSGRLHVMDMEGQGDLPPLILLHGLSANATSYGGLMMRLAPHFRRIIAPDLPGHGFSTTPPTGLSAQVMTDGLFQVLDKIVDEPVMLLGNSMGGLGSVRYASQRQELVDGLILISPGGAPVGEGDQFEAFVDNFRLDEYSDALEFVDKMWAKPPRLLRHTLARSIRSRFTHPQLRRLIESMRPEDMLQPAEIASLAMPVLLVWGHEERILPASGLDFYARHLPEHAEIERWKDFGHVGFLEQPDPLARRIVNFAQGAERKKVARGVSTITPAHATL